MSLEKIAADFGYEIDEIESIAQEYLEKIAISDELAGRAGAERSVRAAEAAGVKTKGLGQYSPSNMLKSHAAGMKYMASPKGQLHLRRGMKANMTGGTEQYFKGIGDIASERGNKVTGAFARLAGKGLNKMLKK